MEPGSDDWFIQEITDVLEASDKEFDEIDVSELTQDVIQKLAEDFYKEISDDFTDVRQRREEIAGFEERLHDHWGAAFDKLEQVIFWLTQIGAVINHEHRFEAVQDEDYVFEALTQLHSRASQIAFEILTLIEHGFADAAYARWRSLHEIAVTANFIKKHGRETAERFLLFENIETYHFAQTYAKYHEELGYDPIPDEVMEELKDRKEELVDRFGDSYDKKFRPGWALHVFDNPQGGLRRLEKGVGLDHHRPFYQLASKSVHSTPKGTLDRIGVVNLPEGPDRPEVMPAGPTNAGFSEPAYLTAVSLNQVTATLATVAPSMMVVIQGLAMNLMLDDVQRVFAERSEELLEKERAVQKGPAEMEVPDIARIYLGFGDLLTADFLNEHTAFDSMEEFVDAAPLDIESVDELNEEDSEGFEEFIADYTEFDSADELAEAAFESWVMNNVDLSDFDVEE